MLWFIGAFIIGIILGALFYFILKKIVKPGTSSQYFKDLTENFFGLLRDEEEFWSSYKNIILGSLRYAGLQLSGFIFALLPVGIFVFFIGQPLLIQWDSKATLTVVPQEAGKFIQTEADQFTFLLKGNYQLKLDHPLNRYVLCSPDDLFCQALVLFGFSVEKVDLTQLATENQVIIRYYRNDRNPFWPYLNDIDFMFSLGFSLIMLVLSVLGMKKNKRTLEKDHQINTVDYMLTCLASYHAGIWKKLSYLEDKLYKRKLEKITIEKPIYISGLARSGSTILLELLAQKEGVATHRYRDFPFLMMPIFWNKFISVFSKEETPKERLHKDRIKINRESPDAFEEPIWQYFFPHIHREDRNHILKASDQDPLFNKFYNDHIKKILYLRKGFRYLSKGNYNISRIEYIQKFHPDALFIIPIRHPLTHVYSLIKQQNNFMEHAENNVHVCDYLQAEGHYEFGPQRKPICITEQGTKRIIEAFESNDDCLGYAIQWADIYRHVKQVYLNNPELAKRIFVLRFEDLCENPKDVIKSLLEFLGLYDETFAAKITAKISPPTHHHQLSVDQIQKCWNEVAEVARLYNYEME